MRHISEEVEARSCPEDRKQLDKSTFPSMKVFCTMLYTASAFSLSNTTEVERPVCLISNAQGYAIETVDAHNVS